MTAEYANNRERFISVTDDKIGEVKLSEKLTSNRCVVLMERPHVVVNAAGVGELEREGATVGEDEGAVVGAAEGETVGEAVGAEEVVPLLVVVTLLPFVGETVGVSVGATVGEEEGALVGAEEGDTDGAFEGAPEGEMDGDAEGAAVGVLVLVVFVAFAFAP